MILVTLLFAISFWSNALSAATFSITFPAHAIAHPIRSAKDNPTGTRRVWGVVAAFANGADMVTTHQTVCHPPLTLNVCIPGLGTRR